MPQGWTAVDEPSGWKAVDEPKGWTPVASHDHAPQPAWSSLKQGGLSDIAGNLAASGDRARATMHGFAEGAKEGASDLAAGTKEGLSGVYQMLRHPGDTAAALGGGLLAGAQAIPDIARNLTHADTAAATVKGFVHGGAEGAAGVSSDELQKNPSRAIGQFIGGTVIPTLATAGAARGVKALRASMAAPTLAIETAGEAGSGPRVTQVKGSGQPIKLKAVEGTPVAAAAPEATIAAEAAAEAAPVAEPAFQTQAARKAPRIIKVAETALADDRPGRAVVDLDAAAPNKNVPGIITKRTPKPGALATAREALGAREAGNLFGMSPEEVRAAAPGPSRTPMKARMADLDSGYNRLINDERGAIDPAVLRTLGLAVGGGVVGSVAADDHPLAGGLAGALGGAALANPGTALKGLQQARMIGMLSGAALPKSAVGNIGAFLTAAAENGSTAPIREMLRVPTNLKNAVAGFANGAHPDAGVVGKFNVFGRAMSGLDAATSQALERAGLTEAERQRLLLNKPSPLGNGSLGKAAQSTVGKAVLPFQTIPMNTVAEGINAVSELAPKSGASSVRKALTVGAGATGAAAGSQTDDPLTLGLLAALAGPRAIPFALGAGLGAGPKVIERVGVGLPDASWKDMLDPLRPINHPALLRLIQQLQGG